MSKYLSKALTEMAVRREQMGGDTPRLSKAYRLNDLLLYRNRAEEEEMLDDENNDLEELKQFFKDNPEPSDEEIASYAEEHGIDLYELRSLVYRLIQDLLDEENDDEDVEYEYDDEDVEYEYDDSEDYDTNDKLTFKSSLK